MTFGFVVTKGMASPLCPHEPREDAILRILTAIIHKNLEWNDIFRTFARENV